MRLCAYQNPKPVVISKEEGIKAIGLASGLDPLCMLVRPSVAKSAPYTPHPTSQLVVESDKVRLPGDLGLNSTKLVTGTKIHRIMQGEEKIAVFDQSSFSGLLHLSMPPGIQMLHCY